MARYRAAIIGAGRPGERRGGSYGIAYAHGWAYNAVQAVEVVAAADIDPENLRLFCDEIGVPSRYADYREMLAREKPDLVSVCTWPQLHAEMTVEAANAGAKGILCEKPMALTMVDMDRMLAACDANGTRLSIDHQRRLGEPFRLAKEIAKSGEIGELYRVEGYVAGSNLYDWGPHWTDMLFFMVDEAPAAWVAASIDTRTEVINWGMRVEDQAIVHVHFSVGVHGILMFGQPIANQPPFRLVGTEGCVECLPSSPKDPSQPNVRARVKGRADWLYPEDPARRETIHARANYTRAVEDLVGAIDEGREPELSGRRGRAATELLIAAYESALRHGRVHLPLPPEHDYSPLDLLMSTAQPR